MFCVLWLLISVRIASSIVPAPANVSLVCKNFQTVVSWTYSQQLLDPLFRVSISPIPSSQGMTDRNDSTTRALQHNLSRVVWRSMMSSGDAYEVEVSALSGDQESPRSAAPRFTFNQLRQSWVQKVCTLALPPVELNVSGQMATISFQNPMKIHPELRWAADVQKSDPLVLYIVVTEYNVTHQGKCYAQDQMCTMMFTLSSTTTKHCVQLNAVLQNDIMVVRFDPEDSICAQPIVAAAGMYELLLALLLGFFVLVVCGLGFLVWKAMACIRSVPSLPKPLDLASWGTWPKNIMEPASEKVCFITAIEQGPSGTGTQDPLDQETPTADPSSDGSEGIEGYAGGLEGLEEEEPEQNYDRPHFIDIGSGDMVWVYGS